MTQAQRIMKKTPDVIIIGSKKSGTRALIKFLNLHPKVRISSPEIHFFDRYYQRGLSWYVSQLPSVTPNSGEINAEKTPGNCMMHYFYTNFDLTTWFFPLHALISLLSFTPCSTKSG